MPPLRLVFVCLGNICRSPAAELLLQKALDERGIGPEIVAVSSAGLRGLTDSPVHPDTSLSLKKFGVVTDHFRAQVVDEELVREADLLITMTMEQRNQLVQIEVGALNRTFTLVEYLRLLELTAPATSLAEQPRYLASLRSQIQLQPEDDISDPYGRSRQVHDDTVSRISELTGKLADSWAALLRGQPAPPRKHPFAPVFPVDPITPEVAYPDWQPADPETLARTELEFPSAGAVAEPFTPPSSGDLSATLDAGSVRADVAAFFAPMTPPASAPVSPESPTSPAVAPVTGAAPVPSAAAEHGLRVVTLSVLGVKTELRCSGSGAEVVAAEIARQWNRCLTGPTDTPDQVIEVCLDDSDDVRVEVRQRGGCAYPTLLSVMHYLSPKITLGAINFQAGKCIMLHAAGLSLPDGRVVGFVAPSGMGKTTLVEKLGSQFGYVTDETLMFDFAGQITPYPKPLSILPEPEPEMSLAQHLAQKKAQVSPDALGLAVPVSNLRLAGIVSLQRQMDAYAEPRLERLDVISGILEIAPQASHLPQLEQPLGKLAAILDDIGGVSRLYYQDATQIAALMPHLAGDS